ncbi:predicted protein [Enterococcus faecalis D6]|nr:predicted protein [Enterococcus faecalis D6]
MGRIYFFEKIEVIKSYRFTLLLLFEFVDWIYADRCLGTV